MGDIYKILGFIGLIFVLLFSLAMLGKSQENVLNNINPIQSVRATNNFDFESYYDTTFDMTSYRQIKKPYILITESESNGIDEPTYKFVDYGTYKEIDSLKCVRYKQMQWKIYFLNKLNEKDCE